MSTKTKLKKLFVSIDFFLAVAVSALMLLFAPEKIPIYMARELFLVSISTLSIVFSVFFAGVAVIMTAGDNEFIIFLEEDGTYSKIIWSYKATLFLLFIALIISIMLFIIVLGAVDPDSGSVSSYFFPKAVMVLFSLIAFWALFAAAYSASDAITYANLRAKFIDATSRFNENSDSE